MNMHDLYLRDLARFEREQDVAERRELYLLVAAVKEIS
jgi:hypothetical protein